MENSNGEIYNFNGLKEKPEELLLLVDKYVRVQLIKNSTFTGFMHSIDPISYSMILSVPQENNEFKTILIPGHAILDIMEVEAIPDRSPPIRKSLESSKEETSKKKDKIIAWLKWNMLPASESGDKIIFGNASLLPPYSDRDICTDNPIVAMQMRKMIKSMPQNFGAPEN
ncbi:gem-associated protein 6-like [Ostrinia furnacalis]|uniref:gem-associated protein 6-like n=1 Tax=Ostrinia furnacalis TaxID=93504 RepID=UPI0010401AC4|nr:gem-associated protein 6-like [Ostrinia furnacalis]